MVSNQELSPLNKSSLSFCSEEPLLRFFFFSLSRNYCFSQEIVREPSNLRLKFLTNLCRLFVQVFRRLLKIFF
jgi:hypothetical protein